MKIVEIRSWPSDKTPTRSITLPFPFIRFDHVPVLPTDKKSYTCSSPGFPPHEVVVKISEVFADPNRAVADVDGYHCSG
jgi:hypothetical protein